MSSYLEYVVGLKSLCPAGRSFDDFMLEIVQTGYATFIKLKPGKSWKRFVESRCVVRKGLEIGARKLYVTYRQYCKEHGMAMEVDSNPKLRKRLESHDEFWTDKNNTESYVIHGIELK